MTNSIIVDSTEFNCDIGNNFNTSHLACKNCPSLTSRTSDETHENKVGSENIVVIEDDKEPKKTVDLKNRFISVNIGFESISIADDSVNNTTELINEEAENIIDVLKSEEIRNSCDKDNKVIKKNRTTTVNTTIYDPTAVEPIVINKADGLQDVLYYIDENGSPKIREKFKKKSKLKKPIEQKRKLTYGTEECIADAIIVRDEKIPSCVSFSKLCQRFKNTFRKYI